MSESAAQAVFLSYASQDAEAAMRICAALRSAGVEVWCDQSELVGGDAWDAKIRGQIGACALFIPVVSSNAQARREGYFRLEWKLAEDRSHLMAKGIPFIVPVTIDGTGERGALVPDAFLAVQWTKLPGGETSAGFVAHVQKLLGASSAGVAPTAPVSPRPSAPAPVAKPGGRFRAVAAFGAVVLALLISVSFWRRQAGPTATDKSIAVLPFTNMSDDKENAFFADGMHEDVLTSLANVGGLKVISRTSVIQYRGSTKSLRQIAAELGVAYVLEGSVRRVGNQVRITGQLIDARTDAHLWAKTYDRELTDIFAMQGELAAAIASALQTAITPLEQSTLAARPTADMAAYDFYMRARFREEAGMDFREGLDEAVSLLESAVKLDPRFVDAWAELALARLYQYRRDVGSPDQLAKAREALDAAVRLAPDAFRVLLNQRQFYYYLEQGEQRAKTSERIARLYPNRAETRIIMASEAWFGARWREALDDLERAVSLDPRGIETLNFALFYQLALRRYDEADALWRLIGEVRPPTEEMRWRQAINRFTRNGSVELGDALMATYSPEALRTDRRTVANAAFWAYLKGDAAAVIRMWQESGTNWRFSNQYTNFELLSVATCYLKLGQREQALPLVRKHRDLVEAKVRDQPDNWGALGDLVLTDALLGESEAADQAMAKARVLAQAMNNLTYRVNLQMDLACALAWLGRKTEAIDLIAATINQPAVLEIWRVHALRRSVHWWPLQGDPRFEALLEDPKNNAPLY